jgi:hypothetical protein
VSDETESDRGSFWSLSGLWQQMAGPFTDLRAFEELSTWGSRTAFDAMFQSVRSGLVGRRVEVGQGKGRVALTVSSLEAKLDPVATTAGQADDVTLTAVDVEWSDYRFTEVHAALGNVHTRLGSRPTLVTAPIDVSVSLSDEQMSELLATRTSSLAFTCVDPGQVRVRLARHPGWGWVECRPSVVGGRVVLQPTGLGRSHRRWRFKRRLPSLRARIELPDNARIVGLDLAPNRLDLHLRIDEWRFAYKDVLGLVRKAP